MSKNSGLTEPAVYKSLALNALLGQFQEGRNYSILDLGPARRANIDFWSQFPIKIYLADLFQSLAASGALSPEAGPLFESALEELLPYPADCRFDVILSWDIFNYLERDQIDRLVRYLGKYCQPGSFFISLISFHKEIPREPTVFKILDRERMVYENDTPLTKESPHYQPREIMKMMVGFEVFGSFILRHGMQEYLFIYRSLSREGEKARNALGQGEEPPNEGLKTF